jgi:hypothetical protein
VEEETVEDEDEDEWYDYGDGERNGKGRARFGECGGEEPLEGEAASCIFSS